MQNAAATVSLPSQQRAARARLASAECLQESICNLELFQCVFIGS